jgi:hypothetical protein
MTRRNGVYHILGERYPSVTTILQVLAKPALIHWAAKTAAGLVLDDPITFSTADAAAGGIYSQRDKAGARGTSVHSVAESWAAGRPLEPKDVTASLQGYARAVKGFFEATQPVPILSEVILVSTTHGYAGRTDLIAHIGDEVALLDFKTGKAVYAEAALQIKAYRVADKTYIDGALTDAEPTDAGYVVLLGEDGSWSLQKQPDISIDVFLAAKQLWEWQQEKAK